LKIIEDQLVNLCGRMNIQLLKAADFNEKLRERGVLKDVMVQRVCRIAKDEKEVREILEAIWENTAKSEEILNKVAEKKEAVYKFEKMLENT